MNQDVVILIAGNDEKQFSLIKKSLARAGIFNQTLHFKDGELMPFLDGQAKTHTEPKGYLLLLDTAAPTDGVKILQSLKSHEVLKRIPVIMLAAANDPRQMDRCNEAGCAIYLIKPAGEADFAEAIRKVGQFLSIVSIPSIGEAEH